MAIPRAILDDICKKHLKEDFEAVVQSLPYHDKILVGGFSGCKIIQDNIKSFLPNYHVIVPEDAELAVLKGAVLFGHKPDYIVARIARYTYGVRVNEYFNPDIHEPGRCVVIGGKKWCKNTFYIYIKTGSVVELGTKIIRIIVTTEPFHRTLLLPIFQSTIHRCRRLYKIRMLNSSHTRSI